MGAIATGQMTVQEFLQLPEPDAFYHELRNGELVQIPRPKLKHYVMQSRLSKLLAQAAGDAGFVEIELAFRGLPEFEFRIADVAFVSRARWEKIDLEDHFRGAPDLVIEVLSPSNTATEIFDKEKLCLENGSIEFWVVDIDLRQIKVSTTDRITTTYRAGQEIPLRLFGSGSLSVDAVFS